MKIKLVTVVPVDFTSQIEYSFEGDSITATYKGVSDIFDFRGLPDGELQLFDDESGEPLIEISLSRLPIVSAKREDGVLYVELISYIDPYATEEECFPEWIDHTEYVSHKIKSESEDEQEERWDDF